MNNTIDFGSYFGQDFKDVVEIDPHYILYIHDNVKNHGVPEEIYQRAVKLIHDECDALDRELDKDTNGVVSFQEFLGPVEESEIDDTSDLMEYCF